MAYSKISRWRIILLDSNPALLVPLHKVHDEEGVAGDYIWTSSIEEARKAIETQLPDLVVAEWQLSDGVILDLWPGGLAVAPFPVMAFTRDCSARRQSEAAKAGIMSLVHSNETTILLLPQLARQAILVWRALQQRYELEHLAALKQERLTLLNRLSQRFFDGEDPNELISWCVTELQRLFPEMRATYSVIDANGVSTPVYSSANNQMPLLVGRPLDLADAPDYLAMLRQHEVVALEDVRRQSIVANLMERFDSTRTRAILDHPVHLWNRNVGLLSLNVARPHNWTQHERDSLSDIAMHLSLILKEKHAQDERGKTEENMRRLATAVEQADESIIITDADAYIQYVNPAFERISGFASLDVLGRTPGFLKSGHHDDAFYKEIWTTLLEGRVWSGHMMNRRKDGSMYEEECSISPVRNTKGVIENFVAIKRDVTHEMEMERMLRQSQKMEALGTLAGGIAHDFNNILQSIIGFADMALEEVDSDIFVYRCLMEVQTAGNRAKDLVSQILAFSRQTEQTKQPVKLQTVVKETIRLLRSTIPPSIHIQPRIDPKCAPVLADPTQVHQIVMNLCTNAYHAMRNCSGTMGINLTSVFITEEMPGLLEMLKPGEHVVLSVSDTGHGMDELTLKRIFEPYYTTKQLGEGTGLGLATVQSIAKSHNAAILVTSTLGEGSRFQVYFPIHGESNVPLSSAPVPVRGNRERILFVDDEQSVVRLADAALRQLNYEVYAYTNPREALEAFQSSPDSFDVLITDLVMPLISGEELIREVLLLRPNIPVILFTGNSETIAEGRLQELRIRDFLRKPVSPALLTQAINRVLANEQNEVEGN